MAILSIRYLPDPVLRAVAKPVVDFDEALHQLIDDMFDTMYSVKGVGLAAPQIGVSLRLAVIDAGKEAKEPLVLVNPELIAAHGKASYTEGCLSVPGAYDTVVRAEKVTLRAQDKWGKSYELEASDLLGECIQHEIDHLNGKLFVDLLSPLKRSLARRKLEKFKRQKGSA